MHYNRTKNLLIATSLCIGGAIMLSNSAQARIRLLPKQPSIEVHLEVLDNLSAEFYPPAFEKTPLVKPLAKPSSANANKATEPAKAAPIATPVTATPPADKTNASIEKGLPAIISAPPAFKSTKPSTTKTEKAEEFKPIKPKIEKPKEKSRKPAKKTEPKTPPKKLEKLPEPELKPSDLDDFSKLPAMKPREEAPEEVKVEDKKAPVLIPLPEKAKKAPVIKPEVMEPTLPAMPEAKKESLPALPPVPALRVKPAELPAKLPAAPIAPTEQAAPLPPISADELPAPPPADAAKPEAPKAIEDKKSEGWFGKIKSKMFSGDKPETIEPKTEDKALPKPPSADDMPPIPAVPANLPTAADKSGLPELPTGNAPNMELPEMPALPVMPADKAPSGNASNNAALPDLPGLPSKTPPAPLPDAAKKAVDTAVTPVAETQLPMLDAKTPPSKLPTPDLPTPALPSLSPEPTLPPIKEAVKKPEPQKTESPKPEQVEPAPAKSTSDNVSLSIAYGANETDVPASVQGKLKELAQKLISDKKLTVSVISYAAGTEDQASIARRVSLSRALAVRAFIIDLGVDNLRINVQAQGNKNPSGNPERTDIVIN